MNNSTENGTTNVLETEGFSQGFRLIASLVYVLLLLLSLIISLLQLAVYIKERKVFKTMAFFIISFQMLINNLLMIIVKIIFMTSTAISDKPIFSDIVYFILAFIECLSYDGLLFFAFLLTLNRLLVFGFPKSGRFIFDGTRIYISITIFWILTGAFTASLMITSCPIVADPESMEFGFHCINGETNIFYYLSNNYISPYFPLLMAIQYILICAEIKIGVFGNSFCCNLSNLLPKNQNTKTQNRAEIKLLIQAAMICLTFFIQNFCWTYLPYMTTNSAYGKELLYIAVMLSSVLLYSVNAIVVLIFNGQVRRTALSFFKKGKVADATTAKTVTLF